MIAESQVVAWQESSGWCTLPDTHLGVEVQIELELTIALHQIHLGQHIHMWHFDMQHGRQAQQQGADVFSCIRAEVSVHQVHNG